MPRPALGTGLIIVRVSRATGIVGRIGFRGRDKIFTAGFEMEKLMLVALPILVDWFFWLIYVAFFIAIGLYFNAPHWVIALSVLFLNAGKRVMDVLEEGFASINRKLDNLK